MKTKKSRYDRFEDQAGGDGGSEEGDRGEKIEEATAANGRGSEDHSLRAAGAADEDKGGGAETSGGPAEPTSPAGEDSRARERDGPPREKTTPATVFGRAVIEEGDDDIRSNMELEVVGAPGKEDEAGSKSNVKLAGTKSLASSRRTFINSIICFIGTGMYGLPAAFQRIGILGGLFGMMFVASVSLHCMFLVVDCRNFLEQGKSKQIRTYGDIGYYAFGSLGARLVDFFVALTQLGACIAYLIVISQSMHEVVQKLSKRSWILLCIPMLMRASWVRSLKSIAPLSLVAELGTGIAAVIVLVFDCLQVFDNESGHGLGHIANESAHANLTGNMTATLTTPSHVDPVVVLNLQGLPYFFGVSIYTFEGIGMVIPVYNSMQSKDNFKQVWGLALVCVALLNTSFGFLGYYAYRSNLEDIIISNLPDVMVTTFMKVSLCVGLFFTYPIMLFPVIEMAEESLQRPASTTWAGSMRWNAFRSSFVLGSAVVASFVPKFTFFIALIGASGGAALAFVLPSAFHLKLRWEELNGARRWREAFCIIVGCIGGLVGTVQAIADLKAAFDAGPD